MPKSSSLTTSDEYSTIWLVKAGDPANQFINALKAKGFEQIILPRLTYITGKIILPSFLGCGILEEARMADCIGVLTEQAV